VALEKTEYLNKIKEILNDTETYEKINKDLTKNLQMKYERYWQYGRKRDTLYDNTYNAIYCSDGNLPRAYGFHIQNNYLISWQSQYMTYSIANFIHRIISKNIVKPPYWKQLSISANWMGYQLQKIMTLYLWMLSRYLRILSNLALENVSNKWCQISKGINIPKNEILKALLKTNIGVNLF